MKKQAFVLMFTIIALTATTLLAACNTMEGLGEDTKAAGRALENAASGNKSY